MKYYQKILEYIQQLNEQSRHDNLVLSAGMYYDHVSKTSFAYPQFENEIDSDQLDYFRFRELELLSQELKRKKVLGQLAEVGVYRGDFSAKMNLLFPQKRLYLFDTFSGFEQKDIEWGIQQKLVTDSFVSIIPEYSNTCMEYVLKKMHYPDQCIFKQGYFPDSLNGLEDTFCLVSIDVDMYLPTLNALKYFYPRLSKDGYIMLHDYNHDELFGVKKAVRDYEKMNDRLITLPICDQCGTLIITK